MFHKSVLCSYPLSIGMHQKVFPYFIIKPKKYSSLINFLTFFTEMKFEMICISLVKHQELISSSKARLNNLKVTHPKMVSHSKQEKGDLILITNLFKYFSILVDWLYSSALLLGLEE